MAQHSIEWEVLRLGETKHVLRNMGTDEALEVSISSDHVSRISTGETVYPGGALMFDVASSPNEDVTITVSWTSGNGEKHSEDITLSQH